jgi:hypothetical protein
MPAFRAQTETGDSFDPRPLPRRLGGVLTTATTSCASESLMSAGIPKSAEPINTIFMPQPYLFYST